MADEDDGYSEEKRDWLGQPYTQHYDKEGNPSGHSEEKKDWLGQPYDAHFDKDGKEAGHSEEKKDWLGNPYTEHHDADGNVSGSSELERDWRGNPYKAHRNPEGTDTGYSEKKRDWLGKPYVSHHGLGAQPRAQKDETPPGQESPSESGFGGGGYEGPSAPLSFRPLSPIGAWEAALYSSAIGALIGRLTNGILGDFFLWGGQGLLGLLGFGVGVKSALSCKGPEFRNGGGIVVGLILIVCFTSFGVHIANSIDRAAPGIWGPIFGGVCLGLAGLFVGPNLFSGISGISALSRVSMSGVSLALLGVSLNGVLFLPKHSSSAPASVQQAVPVASHPSAVSLPAVAPVAPKGSVAPKGRKRRGDLAWAKQRVEEISGADSVELPDLFLPLSESRTRGVVESIWADEWKADAMVREEAGGNHSVVVETEDKVIKKFGKDWSIRFVSAFVPVEGETQVVSRLVCRRGSGNKWEAETEKCASRFGEKFEREVERRVSSIPDEEKYGDFSGKWRAVKNFPAQRIRGVAEARVQQVGQLYRSEGSVKFFDLGSGVFISGYDERGVGTVTGRAARHVVESDGQVKRMTCEAHLSLNSKKSTSKCEYVNPNTGMMEHSEGEAERLE